MIKLWGGRFTKQVNSKIEKFISSIDFDSRLYNIDILGSIAHIKMLYKCEIVNKLEMSIIVNGLKKVKQKIDNKEFLFKISDEDIHMNIERLLHKEIGNLAGKLHTGRSRNDQIALDLHIFSKQEIFKIVEQLFFLQKELLKHIKKNINVILPGYTHLQQATPIRLSHYLLSYFYMFQRDIRRLILSWNSADVMPLGAGALAGSGYKTNRKYLSEILNFNKTYENSIDAVSDRDFIVEFLLCSSMIMMHLSRLSEELIIWNTKEFNFIEFDDAHCTGSSMMPQKKNPDIAELIRGKTGRVYGSLVSILTILKGLPIGYNKDMQEDKENFFDTIDTVYNSLEIYTLMMKSIKFNTKAMSMAVNNGFLNATQLTKYLVNKKITFRNAHNIVGKIVLYCIEQNKTLLTLSIKEYKNFSILFDESVYEILKIEAVVESYDVDCGTAKISVLRQIKNISDKLITTKKWIELKSKIDIYACMK